MKRPKTTIPHGGEHSAYVITFPASVAAPGPLAIHHRHHERTILYVLDSFHTVPLIFGKMRWEYFVMKPSGAEPCQRRTTGMVFDARINKERVGVLRLAALFASIGLSISACNRLNQNSVNFTEQNAKALARTISMLRRGEGPNTEYRVLFYGQSITSRKWTELAAQRIKREYPNVSFRFANMAIGGNAASILKRAVIRDVEEYYPDLVIFHVYGGEKDYDDIIKDIRSTSAAEVILQTDHLMAPVEPLCPVGLNITLPIPAGCSGKFWLHQRNWDDYMSGAIIPKIAQKYGTAIDPRRTGWNNYIKSRNIEPSQLLEDGLHPNERGWQLAASLFNNFFKATVERSPIYSQNLVEIKNIPANHDIEETLNGNRFELITSKPLGNNLEVTIDGIAPPDLPGCWGASRVSSIPWIAEWPALRQVTLSDNSLEQDEWEVKLDKFSADLTEFRFRLYSKFHGFDGEGLSKDKFVSNSGRVSISASDWVLSYAMKSRPVPKPTALSFHWSRQNLCGYHLGRDTTAKPAEYHYIIATGLSNANHNVIVRFTGESRSLAKALMSYRPPVH